MAEYIAQEVALEILQDSAYAYGDYSVERSVYLSAKEKIGRIRTADVAPVRHGQWMRQKYGRYGRMELFECSICFAACKPLTCMGEPIYTYCPYCGARMEEGD